MDFHEMILFAGQAYPGRPALVQMDRVVTFGMLRQGILSVASVLREKGLRRGSVIGIHVQRPTWSLICYLAVAEIGGAAMLLPSPTLLHANDLVVDALVLDRPASAAISTERAPTILTMTERWFERPDARAPHCGYASPDDIALITFSSGTTGVAKPVAYRNGDITTRAGAAAMRDAFVATERMLSLFALPSAVGMARALSCLSSGRSFYMTDDVRQGARMLSLFAIDSLCGSNAQVAKLMDALEDEPTPLPALKLVYVAGSLVTTAFITRLRRILPAEICFLYGSSEAGGNAMITTSRLTAARGGTVDGIAGFVLPGSRVEIVDSAGNPVPHGSDGEIRVHSELVARPWTRDGVVPHDASDAFWHYPGDTGRFDADGMLYITGRTDHLLNIGGVKMAAERLDDKLALAPGVRRAAVTLVPATDGLPQLWAGVVAAPEVSDDRILGWCRMHLPDANITRVRHLDDLPLNAGLKIDRDALRQRIKAAPETASERVGASFAAPSALA